MARDPVQLLAQADKAYSSADSGFSWFGSRTEKYENAAELYISAAGAYRLQQAGQEAGMAYEKAANIQGTKLSEPDDMANTLQDAFKAYRKTCPEDAARCLSQAIDHYVSKGNIRRAATQKQNLAEFYQEKGDNSKARSAYAVAAQWYEDDGAPALSSKLNMKAAQFAALDNDFLDAIKRFEHVAKQAVSSNLMRFSIKDYLLRAGLCHLALDVIGAKRALESYWELDPEFPSTDQGQFLADLLVTVEQGDGDGYQARVDRYELKNRLDSWYKAITEKIKKQLTEKEEDFS
ncbi:MAG: vesicular-fusion protein S17 [Alectoria sarmentosa]|nr:MAG: vesicular-fusion protein S17 [Alectoria sarmentosa]